ncbi:hypothetical protein QQF64_025214 [Cirrhinus molitorella]
MLEQGEKTLEDHTRQFITIANYSSFPDGALCSFYNAGLNPACRALLSEDGPRADFAAYVEWTLASNGSSLTIRPEENRASATPDPEPSPPSPRCVEPQPEPTADGEPEPKATDEPSPRSATELRIASEPEPKESDQVREPATEHATVENASDSESAEWSSAHCTMAEGELIIHLGLLEMEKEDLIDWETELELDPAPLLPPSSPLVPSSPPSSPLVPSSLPSSPLVSSSPEVVPKTPVHASQERPPVPAPRRCPPVHAPQERPPVPTPRRRPPVPAPQEHPPEFSPEDIHKVPPTHPFLSTPLLVPVSPMAHPQPNICVLDAPRVCQSPSASWLEDPSPLPPASESRTPPRPFDPSAPPWLLAPSSPPWPISPPAPPGSLVPPAPPWSVVDHPPLWDSAPPAAPRPSIPSALSGSSFPPAPPQSSVAPAPPRPSGSPSLHRSPVPSVPPWPSGSSPSPWPIGSPSPPRAPPPPAPPPSVGRPPGVGGHSSTMAPPSVGSTMGRHLGCGLGLSWLLLLQIPRVSSLDSVFRPPPGCPSSS